MQFEREHDEMKSEARGKLRALSIIHWYRRGNIALV